MSDKENEEGSEGEGLKLPRTFAVASCNEGNNVAAIEDMAIADISNFSSMTLEDKLEHLHRDLMTLRGSVASMRLDLTTVMDDVSSIKLRVESLSTQTFNNRAAIKKFAEPRKEWASGFYTNAIVRLLETSGKDQITIKEVMDGVSVSRSRVMQVLNMIRYDGRIVVEQEKTGWKVITFKVNLK